MILETFAMETKNLRFGKSQSFNTWDLSRVDEINFVNVMYVMCFDVLMFGSIGKGTIATTWSLNIVKNI